MVRVGASGLSKSPPIVKGYKRALEEEVMANAVTRQKKTYGGATVERFSPPKSDVWPKAINMVIPFEEALKLHLSIGQALGDLNRIDRSTREGKRTAVNLCVYTERKRIVVVSSKLHA